MKDRVITSEEGRIIDAATDLCYNKFYNEDPEKAKQMSLEFADWAIEKKWTVDELGIWRNPKYKFYKVGYQVFTKFMKERGKG